MDWYTSSLYWAKTIETAIDSISLMYEDDSTDATLLVDVGNVFDISNNPSFLHNISYLCRSIAMFVKDFYNAPSRLFLVGRNEISSNEGMTRDDLLSMAIDVLE